MTVSLEELEARQDRFEKSTLAAYGKLDIRCQAATYLANLALCEINQLNPGWFDRTLRSFRLQLQDKKFADADTTFLEVVVHSLEGVKSGKPTGHQLLGSEADR